MISEDEIKSAFQRADIKLFTDAETLENHLLSQKWAAKNLLLNEFGETTVASTYKKSKNQF